MDAEKQLHPAAEIFPLIDPAGLYELKKDIAANGLLEPITLDQDGRILDGRNRYLACRMVGVEPHYRTWSGKGSPVAFVLSLNLHRRHLDESQRAMVAARIATLNHGGDRSKPPIGALTQEAASELLHVGERSLQRAREVLDHGAPELVAAVERGEVAVSAAAALTQLEPADQAAVVALPEDERREVIRDVREGRQPHVSHNSGNNEWYTPTEWVEAARKVMGGIDLDPASSREANRVVKAKEFFSLDDDGLKQKWAGRIWMNPPYSQPQINQFADKLVDAYQAKTVKTAIVLVNNATETAWFRAIAEAASAVCFPNGRIRFWNPSKSTAAPLQGQAVLYLGPSPVTFHARFSTLGMVWVKP